MAFSDYVAAASGLARQSEGYAAQLEKAKKEREAQDAYAAAIELASRPDIETRTIPERKWTEPQLQAIGPVTGADTATPSSLAAKSLKKLNEPDYGVPTFQPEVPAAPEIKQIIKTEPASQQFAPVNKTADLKALIAKYPDQASVIIATYQGQRDRKALAEKDFFAHGNEKVLSTTHSPEEMSTLASSPEGLQAKEKSRAELQKLIYDASVSHNKALQEQAQTAKANLEMSPVKITPALLAKHPELDGLEQDTIPFSLFSDLMKSKGNIQLKPLDEGNGKAGLYAIDLTSGGKYRVGDAVITGAGAAANAGVAALTPDAKKMIAAQYNKTGVLPPMGTGIAGAKNRAEVLNIAAADLKDAGKSNVDALAEKAQWKAATQGLGQLNRQRAQVESFVRTARKNFAMARELSKEVPREYAPIINRAILKWDKSIKGDPKTTQFYGLVYSGLMEYAKVISSATGGGGVVSDTARHEVMSILEPAFKSGENGQFETTLDMIDKELQSRIDSYGETEKQILETMKGEPGWGKAETAGKTGKDDPLGLR